MCVVFFSLQNNFDEKTGIDCVGREVAEQNPLQNLIQSKAYTFSSLYHFGSFIIIADKISGEVNLFQCTELGLRSIALSWRNFKSLNFIGAKIADLQRANDIKSLSSEAILLNLGCGVKIYVNHNSEGTHFEISRLSQTWESMVMTCEEYLLLYDLSDVLALYGDKSNTSFMFMDCIV